MADTHIQLHIDLGGLTAQMQRVLKAATNLVAIGLNATPSITEGSLSIPDTPIQHQFDSNNPWTPDQAKEAWQLWILRNAFRDTAEAVSGTLEEVQTVLSYWNVAEVQRTRGGLVGDDWNSLVVQRSQQFHRRTFPQRVEFLEKTYGFSLDADLLDKVNTINIARNCITHRSGIVTELDLNVQGALEVRWSALVALAVSEGTEVEIHPPQIIEAGTAVAIGTRPKSKQFPTGQSLNITSLEFAQMCWTFLLFAQSAAQKLEEYGREKGLEFGARAP